MRNFLSRQHSFTHSLTQQIEAPRRRMKKPTYSSWLRREGLRSRPSANFQSDPEGLQALFVQAFVRLLASYALAKQEQDHR
mmetsp:Transcript_6621/g.13413  ORF Transcript_6621/g.13413 Transcript_6621/m.13413 type:complete len:81 (-) Transcript_6621:105-347(-)